jgi:hypothetical protein
MAERKRRKRQLAPPTTETMQSHAAPPLVGEFPVAQEERQTLAEHMDDTTAPQEPKSPEVTEAAVGGNVEERRPFMEQSNETTGESGITSAGTAIKNGVVGSLKGVNEIETQLVSVVGNAVSDTLRTTGTVARDGLAIAKDVVSGTVQTVADVGTELTTSVKDMAKGVVTGVSEVGGDVLNVAQQTAKGVITGVADIGALVGDVANRTARGTIGTTKEIGENVGALARTTLEGTIAAADSIGGAAVKTVSHLLVSVVEGVKDVLNAALPRASAPKE